MGKVIDIFEVNARQTKCVKSVNFSLKFRAGRLSFECDYLTPSFALNIIAKYALFGVYRFLFCFQLMERVSKVKI